MAKNIIICCDGTGNQLDENYSNVVKLYSLIKKIPGRQVAYYDPGVGTLPHDKVLFRPFRKIKKIVSLALGNGLEDNVSEAYSFLMDTYEDGDHIYLFGFSRGAYTVRVLAGLIREMGLLERGCQNLIPYAWTFFRECFRDDVKKLSPLFKKYFSRDTKVHFMGVWDTVSSVGLLTGPKSYPHTQNNSHVTHLRHAIAIDERRRFYRQNLFTSISDNKNMKQVWFAGVHSDIGGSYPLDESGLSQITLKWMVREAKSVGLEIDEEMYRKVIPDSTTDGISAPDPFAKIHPSLTSGWKIAEYFPKRDRVKQTYILPRGMWRRMFIGPTGKPIRPTLHESVKQRLMKGGYAPENLEGRGEGEYDIEN